MSKIALMVDDYEKQKRRRLILRRSLTDYVVGVLIFVLGAFFLTRQMFDLALNVKYKPDYMDKVFGVICLLYGGWRVYRGYKKNYFN